MRLLIVSSKKHVSAKSVKKMADGITQQGIVILTSNKEDELVVCPENFYFNQTQYSTCQQQRHHQRTKAMI